MWVVNVAYYPLNYWQFTELTTNLETSCIHIIIQYNLEIDLAILRKSISSLGSISYVVILTVKLRTI